MTYKTLNELPPLAGVPVLIRLDTNVPVKDGIVADDYRIRKAIPAINFLRQKGAKVIIIGHIEGGSDTLKPVFERLKQDMPVLFCDDVIESGKKMVATLKNGSVLLCENLRLYDGEKKNDETFARTLASLGEIYVNEAFSVSHRKHASIVGVPKFLPSYIGPEFEEEIKHLSLCFNPPHPFVFLLGGAKIETKLPLVTKFLTIADVIIIGGALANDVYKAQGLEVGTSLTSATPLDLTGYSNNPKIVIPSDVIVETPENERIIKSIYDVGNKDQISDVGPQSIKLFETIIAQAQTVLWNGPLGNYEQGFKEPTLKIAEIIASTKATTIVGGGDTLAAISELHIEDKFTFLSTGGGAMLDFLANGTLPGLEALKEK